MYICFSNILKHIHSISPMDGRRAPPVHHAKRGDPIHRQRQRPSRLGRDGPVWDAAGKPGELLGGMWTRSKMSLVIPDAP